MIQVVNETVRANKTGSMNRKKVLIAEQRESVRSEQRNGKRLDGSRSHSVNG